MLLMLSKFNCWYLKYQKRCFILWLIYKNYFEFYAFSLWNIPMTNCSVCLHGEKCWFSSVSSSSLFSFLFKCHLYSSLCRVLKRRKSATSFVASQTVIKSDTWAQHWHVAHYHITLSSENQIFGVWRNLLRYIWFSGTAHNVRCHFRVTVFFLLFLNNNLSLYDLTFQTKSLEQ